MGVLHLASSIFFLNQEGAGSFMNTAFSSLLGHNFYFLFLLPFDTVYHNILQSPIIPLTSNGEKPLLTRIKSLPVSFHWTQVEVGMSATLSGGHSRMLSGSRKFFLFINKVNFVKWLQFLF
jgi:hypothetical protein